MKMSKWKKKNKQRNVAKKKNEFNELPKIIKISLDGEKIKCEVNNKKQSNNLCMR